MPRIGQMAPGQFTKPGRPHGILISTVKDAATEFLRSLQGDPVAVRGEIGIFGEREEHARQSLGEHRARSPYLEISMVGCSVPENPVELLNSYFHPCISAGYLMPVDSNLFVGGQLHSNGRQITTGYRNHGLCRFTVSGEKAAYAR